MHMQQLKNNTPEKVDFKEDLSQCAETLRQGGFIRCNTDCGWIVACDSSNRKAVKKLLELPGHALYDPVLLVGSTACIQRVVEELPDICWDLIELSDAPLILQLEQLKNLPEEITTLPQIGFRVSDWTFTNYLCERIRFPLFCLQSNKNIKPEFGSDMDLTFTVRYAHSAKPTIPSIIKLGKGGRYTLIRK